MRETLATVFFCRMPRVRRDGRVHASCGVTLSGGGGAPFYRRGTRAQPRQWDRSNHVGLACSSGRCRYEIRSPTQCTAQLSRPASPALHVGACGLATRLHSQGPDAQSHVTRRARVMWWRGGRMHESPYTLHLSYLERGESFCREPHTIPLSAQREARVPGSVCLVCVVCASWRFEVVGVSRVCGAGGGARPKHM